jgi:prepilin-type N-terminal cleavage/methylation domain-containing protein
MPEGMPNRPKGQEGFTLVEMLIAMVVVLFGLVAVAQLVPTSVLLNSNNRSDGTALVFAEREMEAMREQPLSATTFSDPAGVACPTASTCHLGDPKLPLQVVGNPVVLFNNAPVISNFSTTPVAGYGFTYTDPNDPFGATYDVRWAVISNTNASHVLVSRRIILSVFRRGMTTPTYPVTLDLQVEK